MAGPGFSGRGHAADSSGPACGPVNTYLVILHGLGNPLHGAQTQALELSGKKEEGKMRQASNERTTKATGR